VRLGIVCKPGFVVAPVQPHVAYRRGCLSTRLNRAIKKWLVDIAQPEPDLFQPVENAHLVPACMIGIAAFYDRDLETARKNIATAAAVATKIHDIGAQIRFTTVLGLGLVEAKMYDRALPYFDNALAIAKKTPDAGYPFLTHEAQLEALIGLNRYDDAQHLADEMVKQIGPKYWTGPQAEILIFEARIALGRGDVPHAIQDLEKWVSICKIEGYQQEQARPEAMLSEIFRNQGNLPQAEYYAAQAAADTQATGDKWSIPERLQALARLQVAQGKNTDADRTYDRASAFIDSGLANSSSVFEKTSLIKASGTLYPEHFALLASRLNNAAKAYAIVEQVRGRVTADLLMSGSLNSQGAKRIEHTISSLQLQMMSAKSVQELNRLRDQIFTAEEARWISPGISILKRRAQETVPIERVQHSLDPSTAILEYIVAEPHSYCLVVSRNSFHIVLLTGEGRINQLVSAYLKAVKEKLPAHLEAKQLFNSLLLPVPEVQNKQELVIIPDGQLHLVPFGALENRSASYLIESHIIAYSPSATSFYLLTQESGHAGLSVRPLLGVGGIPYSEAPSRPVSLIRGTERSMLVDLPYSKQEVLDANSAIVGSNELLLGEDATESAFKRAASRRFGTIHLAVHGLAGDPDPDQAGLALLPNISAGEDGLLHASEIATMHVNANLVVLSSCDTAVGPIEGEEGISTLSNSFLLAGAKSVVSTLWSVEDTSSLFLMKRFYSRIADGDSPAIALTTAQREMLHSFRKAAVPYFWAGFKFEGVPGSALH
jgi:CHAT domain-containing protein